MRLDRWLREHCPTLTLARLQSTIRQGEVRINGDRATAAHRLVDGDSIRLPPLLRHHWLNDRVRTPVSSPINVEINDLDIIYEDDAMVAVNKPAGLACHGGSGISWGVIEVMRERFNQPKMELVHRLDRETSGILLLSRSRLALRPLHQQFREGQIKKEYRAIVHGAWSSKNQHLRHPLFKFENDDRVHKVIVSARGKPAHTEVEILASQDSTKKLPILTFLRLMPHTGRTHQIRVHLAHEGHPILGDARYADFSADKLARAALHLKSNHDRMYLHAFQITLRHPLKGQPLTLKAPLPHSFNKLLESAELKLC